MPSPSALLVVSDVQRRLHVGGMIGRGLGCEIIINDARVSEAHALLSERGGHLWLLALRGSLRLHTRQGDRTLDKIEIRPGYAIELAPDLLIHVEEVCLPEDVWEVSCDGRDWRLLERDRHSIDPDAQRWFLDRYSAAAPIQCWQVVGCWFVGASGSAGVEVSEGDAEERVIPVGGWKLRFRNRARGPLQHTLPGVADAPQRPLRIEVRPGSVRVYDAEGALLVETTGQDARLLALLASHPGTGLTERRLHKALWPDQEFASNRPQVVRTRLRDTLRRAGLRRDLVDYNRQEGTTSLVLTARDQVVLDARSESALQTVPAFILRAPGLADFLRRDPAAARLVEPPETQVVRADRLHELDAAWAQRARAGTSGPGSR